MTDALPVVNLAVHGDEEDILDLLRARHLEHGSPCRWDDDRVRINVRLGTAQQSGVIGVVRGERGVEASVGLFPCTEWYSWEPILHDRWFFVHPHFRQSNHAKGLLAFSKQIAKGLGLQLRLTEIGDPANGLIRFLSRHSVPIGGMFVYDGRQKGEQLAAAS